MLARAVRLLLAAALVPPLAAAQVPNDDNTPRSRLRDRYRSPQNAQKLSDNVRKLNGDNPEERLEAIRGLGEVNDPKAIEYLVRAANDPDMRIRIKAIDTLGQIKAKDATPLLIQQLFMRDTDIGTKRRILASLGKIGDTRATSPIVDFLARDLDPAARGNAIFALGDIADPAAVPPLEAIANDGDPLLRGIAAEALRKIRDRPSPEVVPPALAGDRRGPGAQAPTP
ncbi:MAG TPA: HEAT repeat domain-containing protein [Candidatus Binatia bacterium]|nr:HEAT repeat domain-containing protein [Candidatus Binatia bacterium]